MHIYLTGFMGAGKTTVGKILASRLNRPFIDLDQLIEQEENLALSVIFENLGENYFRQLESKYLSSVIHAAASIVATGGGIVLSDKNRKIMRATGIIVYLKWHINILYRRLKNSTHRPLLKGIDQSQLYLHIKTMFTERRPFYEQADYIIPGDEKTTPEKTVSLILEKISLESIQQSAAI